MQIKINYLNKEGQSNDAVIDVESREKAEEIRKEILGSLINKEDIILKGKNDVLFLSMDSIEICKVSMVDEEPAEIKIDDKFNYNKYHAQFKPLSTGVEDIPDTKKGYATGINNSKLGIHLVGDYGKELLCVPKNHGKLLLEPTGNQEPQPINITINGMFSPEANAEAIAKEISKKIGAKELLQPVNVSINTEHNMDKIFEEMFKKIGNPNKGLGCKK